LKLAPLPARLPATRLGSGLRQSEPLAQTWRPPGRSGWPVSWAAAGALLLGSGCLYLPSKSGTGRVLVVGIGLVSIHDRTNSALVATSTQVVGLEVSNRPGLKFGLGYASSVVTTASDGAEDVRAEISHWPFGPLHIRVDRAALSPSLSPFPLTPNDDASPLDTP